MKKNVKTIIALLLILLASVGVCFGISNINKNSKKILIVTTNFPAYDFARAIIGDAANVKMLIKPGAETHDFEPTPSDIIDIKNSKLFIYTGGESDAWVTNILNDAGIDKVKLFKMIDIVNVVEEEIVDGMEENHDADTDAEEAEYDEHVWTSIKNAIKIISSLKDELIKISPENKAAFEKNTDSYINRLANIDSQFQEIVNSGNRKIIIFGDRFPLRYFADDYGLDYFAAFPGCSEQTEASSQTIAFLIDKVKAEKIPVVFKIEMSSGNIAKTIADETGAEILTFNTMHNIPADDFKDGRTYAEIMEDNLKVLREALK